MPLALIIVLGSAGALAGVPPLRGVAAALMHYAWPLGMGLILLAAVGAIRRLAASPTWLDGAVGYLTARVRRGVVLVGMGVVGWQAALGVVHSTLLSQMQGVLFGPGGVVPLQSDLWFLLQPFIGYAIPVLGVVLVVKLQHRLERARVVQA